MRLAILGAGGFLGSHLLERLVLDGEHDLRAVDISADKIAGVESARLEVTVADLGASPDLVDDFVQWSDAVIDLVAVANPSLYVESPLDVFELNFMKNLDVVRSCVEHHTRLIQFSTSEIYGQPTGERYLEDESPLVMGPVSKQRWIYGSAKAMLERVIHAYGLEDRLDYVVFRPFNIIGPRLDYLVPAGTLGGPRVFAHFMSALLTNGPMHLVNGGTVRRCFTHVDDAISGVLATLDDPRANRQAFNLGNPDNETTIRGLAELMVDLYTELTGSHWTNELVDISGEAFYGTGYEDTNRVPPDVAKLRALGWRPDRDLKQTVRDSMRYYL